MPLHSGVHATKMGDAINFQEASQASLHELHMWSMLLGKQQ